MALLMGSYALPNGLVSKQAYIKVDTISGNTEKISVDVKVYISKEVSDVGLPYIDNKYVSFNPDVTDNGLNYHKQAFVWQTYEIYESTATYKRYWLFTGQRWSDWRKIVTESV